MDAWKWKGVVALVTGASAGIGEAIVKELTARGTHVIGCARREKKLKAMEQELKDAGAEGQFFGIECDLGSPDSIEQFFVRARQKVAEWAPSAGCAQILINNAGLGHVTSLIDGKPSDWEEMFAINVMALARCTKLAVSDMLAKDAEQKDADGASSFEGHVIHVSSISGHRIPPESPHGSVYSSTKYAVRAMAEGLRMELVRKKSKIRVTHLCPGLVKTEFAQVYTANKDHKVYDSPHMEAKDVADAAVYVLGAPVGVSVNDLIMRPTFQRY